MSHLILKVAFYDPRNPITFLSILKLKRCFLYIYPYCIIPTPLPYYILYRESYRKVQNTDGGRVLNVKPRKSSWRRGFSGPIVEKSFSRSSRCFQNLSSDYICSLVDVVYKIDISWIWLIFSKQVGKYSIWHIVVYFNHLRPFKQKAESRPPKP